MDRRNAIITSVVVLGIGVAAAWGLGYLGGTDPVVAEMQQLRDTMFANRDLPDDQRRAQWQEFRQRMDGLTDAQRDALRRDGRERWQQFAQQRMDEFFTLPKAEQQKRLDEIIDRMVQRQNERRQNPNAGDGRGGGDGGGWGGGRGDRGRNMTDAQRDQRRKERLDRIDPKMRAQFSEFGRRINDRLQERGMPPMEGRGPWRGGWGSGRA